MSLSPFNQANDIVDLGPQSLITSTWSNNTNDLNVLVTYTSSLQGGDDGMTSPTSSGMFYIDVYNAITGSTNAEVQLALAYGNHLGSGSPDFTNDTGSLGVGASRVVYGQYRNLVFDNETSKFTFGDHTPESIYVINVNRARYKQKLSPGSLNLHISGASVAANSTQSIIHLTDDSVTRGATVSNPNYVGENLGGYYNIVTGSNGSMSGSVGPSGQITINTSASLFGFFYPHAGLIILNGDAFSASFGTMTSASAATAGISAFHNGNQTTYDKPHQKFFDHIVGGGTFIVDTEEQINSKYYFVRARNSEFNYTNNESFTDADNRILHSTMQFNPKVFITTVGLYNNAAELVAVAKLSQPVAKDFTKEALVRVKLDY
tara:strand:- start:23 stop:1150 length:1128 start_codon:yes stop_codon:yes gene_type:complete